MKELIQFVTIQFQENSLVKKLWLKIYNELYQISKTEFEKTCSICYEISNLESYCNYSIPNIGKREDLIKFVQFYEFVTINVQALNLEKLKVDEGFTSEGLTGIFSYEVGSPNDPNLNIPNHPAGSQLAKEAHIFNQGQLF